MTDTSRNKLSAATNKVIDNSNYVTRQKIMNANPGSRYKTIFLQADFTRTNTEKVLNLYINSHDNLIISIYKK